VSGRERSMSSTADGRVFREEEPTGRFRQEQLDALRARSLEKSALLKASIDGPRSDSITTSHPIPVPPAARPPTPTSPEFLGKSTAVLVLPSEPPPAPSVVVEAPAPLAPPAVERPAPAPAVVRSHRRLTTRALVKPRLRVWRHVIKLGLLALVVVCQPWWWNVGDLHARTPARTATAAK
jgi:hypothetical protein